MKKPKFNFILQKRQIFLAALVLVLGTAVYLNWQFANTDSIDLTDVVENNNINQDVDEMADASTDATDVDTTEVKDETQSKNFGDTLFVDAKTIGDENYFETARLARTKSRDEAIETISTVLNDENLTDDQKQELSSKAVSISDIIESESRIENLIKAKGFEECVVYITETSANVVVKTDGLDQDKATQIKNIVVSEGKIAGENVAITEVN